MNKKAHPLAPSDPLEPVWRALSDPTRRAMLDHLRVGPLTTGDLASRFPQSRFATMKHLDVLVAAGLVVVRREGRERWNQLNPVPLQQMYERWVRPYEALWAAPLVRLKNTIEATTPSPQERIPMTDQTTLPPAAHSPAGMLTVRMEIPIAAPCERVWHALTAQIDLWWPRDFRAATDPLRMEFDATLGGRIHEHGGDGGGVIWYTVYAITPGVSVDLAGNLSPAFGGPAQSLLRLVLRDQEGNTVLELTDAVVGNVGPRTADTNRSGWEAIFANAFRTFVEHGLGGPA